MSHQKIKTSKAIYHEFTFIVNHPLDIYSELESSETLDQTSGREQSSFMNHATLRTDPLKEAVMIYSNCQRVIEKSLHIYMLQIIMNTSFSISLYIGGFSIS